MSPARIAKVGPVVAGCLAVLLLGCGRLGFDLAGDADADADASAPADAASLDGPNPPDAALGSFSPPTVIAELSDPVAFDADATLTADGLEIFFTSDRPGGPGGKDIWTSSRATPADIWQPPVPVSALSTVAQESAPHVSADGLTIWLATARPGGAGGLDTWTANRPMRTGAWSALVPVVELNTSGNDNGFAVTASQLVGYLQSGQELYRTTRSTPADPWSPRVPVTDLNTVDDEENPAPSGDDRIVFFASDRPGGAGAADLYVAIRPSAQAPFDAAVALAELNAASYDSDPCLGDGLRTLIFSSNRNGGGQQFDLFEATR
jgi:hypothetical protein